jgi:hypothetical protein
MQILEVLRWPLAAVSCVLIVVIALRNAPLEFFSRSRRPGSGDKSILVDPSRAFAINQQRELEQVKPAGKTVHADHVLPPPNQALDQFEREIQSLLSEIKLPPELEKAWLIRIVAHWRMMYGHEVTYRLIVGSHITLLLLADTISPPNTAKARELYEAARTTHPEVYTNFTFETWINWPVMRGLLTRHVGDEAVSSDVVLFKITPLGQDFLLYLFNNSLTAGKVG